MRILLSAFSCRPNSGSEAGVGWRWAMELGRAGHQVVLLTDITGKSSIDAELALRPQPNLTVVCYRPNWLKRVPLASAAQLLYIGWQYSLLPLARRLQRQHDFDLILHITYGVFRNSAFLGYVGPPFVFGPVGGGEDAPWALKQSLSGKEKCKELLRSALNRLALLNPLLRLSLGRAALILVKTADTLRALPRPLQAKALVYSEIGIDLGAGQASRTLQRRLPDQPLELLFVGRMLGWKGAHLALRALAAARGNGVDARLTLVGKGPLLDWLKALVERLGLAQHVTWIGHIPQAELFAVYGSMHAFLFPSLHDSSGNVVLEALSFGLPVICLDIGGPATLVDASCAQLISAVGRSETEVVAALAQAVAVLEADEALRYAQAEEGWRRAAATTWEKQVREGLALMRERTGT